MKIKIFISLIISILYINDSVFSQAQSRLDLGLRTIESKAASWGLDPDDLSDLAVSDQYQSDHNKVTHIYFIQRYKGIEIHNAITSVHVTPDGKVFDSPSRFFGQLDKKVNATKARLDASEALKQVVLHLDIPNALVPKNLVRSEAGKMEFMKTNFTHSNIPVKQVYYPTADGRLLLAWDLNLDLSTSNDYWSVWVDALSGEILGKQNLNIKCQFDHPGHKRCVSNQMSTDGQFLPVKQALQMWSAPLAAPNTYNVVPIPFESPNHGPRQLVVNPASPTASPFGWHDTNGAAGAEYNITRGNNVHAYPDRNGNNLSDGNEPDGGSELIFDFPFDENEEPSQYTKAATVNLFYMNNMMHDVMYGFGFNEAAGNFQFNNYNKGGMGGDYVQAEAQDGSGTDNANFATPPDGANPRMQMFLWLSARGETYISKPDSLAGSIDTRAASGWGGSPPPTIEAEAVIANDHSPNPTQGCTRGMRRSEIGGKIVLIDRGTCEFGLKALNAQDSGAVAVIICNFEDAFLAMGGGAVGSRVTIPAYFTTKSICDRLKLVINNGGLRIEIREPGGQIGPDSLDGAFDNGIISHEYGHGVSNRLTGGPSNANCLGNEEQMGEGWSDFFALIMQAKTGDIGSTPRGLATYAWNERPDGNGLRRRPYTTDMKINEFTYKNIDAEEHNLGEVWATVLWDLYWAFADKYGFDPDFKNKTSGNNICIQLVMDGMKIQPCSPGFINGRDAILKADSINNGAKNACLIWEVFARRGMGYAAKQGSSNSVGDETESYLPALICNDKFLVDKRSGYYKDANTFIRNDVVRPGEDFSVTIEAHNYKVNAATNVVVTDHIPAGCSYVSGSANYPVQQNGDQLIWTIPNMKSLETLKITYKLKADAGAGSTTLWYDDVEVGEDNWDIDLAKGDQVWYRDEGYGVNQSYSWIAEEKEGISNDFVLFTKNQFQLTGTEPSLYFYHFYNTEQGYDGGFIEVSKDGFIWKPVRPEQFSLNGYSGLINYNTFTTPNLSAFSGQSREFIPTVLDLSEYAGEKIQIRFRFGNDSLIVSPDNSTILGWVVDNIEFIHPKFYNAEVCASTAGGDNACASLFGKGVLVDSDKIVGTKSEKPLASDLRIFPNPAGDYFLVKTDLSRPYRQLILRTVSGQEIKRIDLDGKNALVKVPASDLPRGMILVEAVGDRLFTQSKLILH